MLDEIYLLLDHAQFGKMSKVMRLYDLVLVLKSSVKEADQKKLLETIKGWLKDVKVVKEDAWGQKPLAYTVKKEVSGVYHRLQLETENAIPQDLEQKLLQQENVLRHLLLRKK